jgi:hypothetical protein
MDINYFNSQTKCIARTPPPPFHANNNNDNVLRPNHMSHNYCVYHISQTRNLPSFNVRYYVRFGLSTMCTNQLKECTGGLPTPCVVENNMLSLDSAFTFNPA